MCGICGWVTGCDPLDGGQAVLDRMTDALAHRGPDARGTWTGPGVFLGHRRLAVIDPSPAGGQPMHISLAGPGGLSVVLNGEIYDYRNLRAELVRRGCRFRTGSDTEVLLQGVAEWGMESFLEQADGMFAFALWEHDPGRLHLARDRMGEKPLYYAHLADGALVFGSELVAVRTHPGVSAELDPVSLRKYLAYDFVPAPRSILAQVRKLEAGHRLVWEGGRIVRHGPYWDMPQPEPALSRPGEAARALWESVRAGVRSRLVSDVPVGIFLSGGLDSTAVAAAACEIRDPESIRTFSVGFDDPSFDESVHARRVARHLGTDHSEELLTAGTLLDLLPGIVRTLDEPLADPSLVPTHLLARFTRRHVKVALGGDGGDELLLGYPTFFAHAPAKLAARVPAPLRRRLVEPLVSALPVSDRNWSLDYRLKRLVHGLRYGPFARHFAWIGGTSPDRHADILDPCVLAAAAGADPYDDVDRLCVQPGSAAGDLDRLIYLYARLYLGEGVLQKVDRATMSHGLESRAPLLSEEVVRTCSRIPARLKLRGTNTKWVLRHALAGKVPESILRRPKKGFGIPLTRWLGGPLLPLARDLLSPSSLRSSGVFAPGAGERLIAEHLARRQDHRKTLWAMMVFQLWRARWWT